ncbi:MAG: hypothetical protein JHC33_14070 [Ignisphaera sp.]|nr:hypothetical protein [Ignisphaera sp.]
MVQEWRRINPLIIGIIIGVIDSFANSYSYAVSGFTTSELSIIYIPLLVFFLLKMINKDYSLQEVIYASAIAIGIDITTTLTSGMYVTFTFFKYLSSRLSSFGLNVEIPLELSSNVKLMFIDIYAMPTYVTLALISLGGAFIAFAVRNHFLEKERLRYPLGTASAIILHTLTKSQQIKRSFILTFFILGLVLQLVYFIYQPNIDLTPTLSTVMPGLALNIVFIPMVFSLFLLFPLGPLRLISLGSLLTYLLLVPLAIELFNIVITPAQSYDNALFSISPIVLSYNVGFIIAFLLYYIIVYGETLQTGIRIAMKFTAERQMMLIGITYLILLGVSAMFFDPIVLQQPLFIIAIMLILLLHFIIILGNIRVVGEAGTGSQALYPIATLTLYIFGVRDPIMYAALDPYTGIPMPQTIASTTMNLLRASRLSKCDSMKVLKYFVVGVLLGSIITYIYGNILISVFGTSSAQMPLDRWIPTTVFMAMIYSGKLSTVSLRIILLAVFLALIFAVASHRYGFSLASLLVGLTLTPDIGFQALLAYIVKSIVSRLGPAAQGRLIVAAVSMLLGAALALAIIIILSAVGLSP